MLCTGTWRHTGKTSKRRGEREEGSGEAGEERETPRVCLRSARWAPVPVVHLHIQAHACIRFCRMIPPIPRAAMTAAM